MTRKEAYEEFGLTGKQAGYALKMFDWFPEREYFCKAFQKEFKTDRSHAYDALEFAHWANEPENIHIFY